MKKWQNRRFGTLSLGVLLALFTALAPAAKEGPALPASAVPLDPPPRLAWGLDVTEDGHLWVSDVEGGAVLEYGADGRRTRSLQWKERGGHEPWFLVADGETIAVAEGHARIVFFDRKEGIERGVLENPEGFNLGLGFLLWKGDVLLTGHSYVGCMEPAHCMNTLVLLSRQGRKPVVVENTPVKPEDLPALFCLYRGHPVPLKGGKLLLARSLPAEFRLYDENLSLLRRVPFYSEPHRMPPLTREDLLGGSAKVDVVNRGVVQILGAGIFGGRLWALFQRPGPREPVLELRFFTEDWTESLLLPLLLPDGFPPLRFVKTARISPSGILYLLVQDAEPFGRGRTRILQARLPALPEGPSPCPEKP